MPVMSLAGPVVASATLALTPSDTALPGSSVINQLLNGIGWWGLVVCLVGVVVGAASWAIGSHTNSYQHASAGRRAVLVSGAAALVIGAAPQLLNFLFTSGQAVH